MSTASMNYARSRRSGKTSTARGTPVQSFNTAPLPEGIRYFVPCAATDSLFLHAQGHSILCCRHEKLTIERTFSRHGDEIQLLALDNVSERGAGRLAVSYDAGQTAIVWDIQTGEEISRFASFEPLTTAAWMRNGNVVFGNTQGSIILFEPATSEHISCRTLDQIAITALAPSADCKTFAIGYSNGSLLVATLQPRFTILHNLTTSRGPSPIVTLAWHASSSRQKSDMLAVQTHDGDLRVWSVNKAHNADDPAKVVRILRRNENYMPGPNWMGWSKNGRIIQFSDSETLSWDVRTKHVTSDSIPTLAHVRGIAVYGPGASLFTLGPNNTVQQFDLNSPAIMVANVQHPAGLLPPSPPTSDEIGAGSIHSTTTIHTSGSESGAMPLGMISESDDEIPGPYSQFTRRPSRDRKFDRYENGSTVSNRSGMSSASRSARSQAMTEYTHISAGSSLRSSTVGRRNLDNYSMGYSLASTSVPSVNSSSRSRNRPSRLKHEVAPNFPDGNMVQDLFQFTRARLDDIPYRPPMASNSSRLTNEDLRRQMLSTIFGWQGEVEDLIRDEMSRHPSGATSRILLAKWLGDMDLDSMIAGSQNMSSSDWMLLALSSIGGQASQQKLGRAYVQRLLESKEVHVAVTIMLGLGDHNDAIEVYISHKQYMEALILACLLFPSVWERQAAIIRKWGEWAVQHGQQQLAIRCFASTGQESTEPWSSPSARQLTFQSMTPSMSEVWNPPLSPPSGRLGSQRNISSSLKVITSFGDQNPRAKMFPQFDDGETPIATRVNPIGNANFGAGYDTARTAFPNPPNDDRFKTPTTARPVGPSFARDRLPSIGESPFDLNRGALEALEGPALSRERPMHSRTVSAASEHAALGKSLQRSATASPMIKSGLRRAATYDEYERSPSSDDPVTSKLQQVQGHHKTGSRDRNTRGLQLQLKQTEKPSLDQINSRYQQPARRRGPGSVSGSVASSMTSAASSVARSYRTDTRQRGRDDYIHSLDAAQDSVGRTRSRGTSKRRGMTRDPSEERGRHTLQNSPTSPVSMSPRDLAVLGRSDIPETAPAPLPLRKTHKARARGTSRASSRARGKGRARSGSRSSSPTGTASTLGGGTHYQGSEDEEDYQRALQAREDFRNRHCKSASRGLNQAAMGNPTMVGRGRALPAENVGDLRQIKDERQKKRVQAARELENRRRSLATRQNATQIPHPNELSSSNLYAAAAAEAEADEDNAMEDDMPLSLAELQKAKFAKSKQHYVGLPATPKAMILPLRPSNDGVKVPPIPAAFAPAEPEKSASPQDDGGSLLTLLPSTVYQPPSRAAIPRSMSAPIPEPGSGSRRPHRKGSAGEMRGLSNIMENGRSEGEEAMPPPQSQAIRRDFQNLSIPPPPPIVPLPNVPGQGNRGGALGAGMIEIVRDDDGVEDDASGDDEPGQPMMVAPPNDGMVPVLPTPVAPIRGHERQRSQGEGSISSRSSRLAERLFSSSRSRQNSLKAQGSGDAEAVFSQLRSPPANGRPPVAMYDPGMIRKPFEYHQRKNSTGLHESEMI